MFGKLKAADVVTAYQKVYGRKPDQKEVDWRLGQRLSMKDLYTTLIDSQEFQMISGNTLRAITAMYMTALKVEVDIDDPATLAKLNERIVGQWRKLGEAEPHWSIWPDPTYKKDVVQQGTIDNMYESGRRIGLLIEVTAKRTRQTITYGKCYEHGCGIGRETYVLADLFDEVLAVEVSSGALKVCDRYLHDKSIGNVTTRLATKIDDFAWDEPYDFFYSWSVLEHSPAPVQKAMLEKALATLKPGGHCLFNTPAYIHDYSFKLDEYMRAGDQVFELHCLPTADVLRILRDLDVDVLDFVPDDVLPQFGSILYFGRKRG